jgi:hypothetical protein
MPHAVPLLSSLLILSPLTLPAQAEPVARTRLALASFTLGADTDTSQRISLTVTTAARPRLTLQVSDCDANGCVGVGYFETRLAPSAVKLDPEVAAGELRTVLAGRALHVVWTPDDRPVVMGGTEGSSDEDSETLSVYRADPAHAKVSFDGASCSTDGGVGDEIRLENPDGDTGSAQPLRRFRPAQGLTCEPVA